MHFTPHGSRSQLRSLLLRFLDFTSSCVFVSHAKRLPQVTRRWLVGMRFSQLPRCPDPASGHFWLRLSQISESPASLRKKYLSIHLDTPSPGEQDDVVVSPFKARLPQHSRNAVSLRAKLHHQAQEGRTSSVPFYSLARAQPPVRRTGRSAHQHASGSRPQNSNLRPLPGEQECRAF